MIPIRSKRDAVELLIWVLISAGLGALLIGGLVSIVRAGIPRVNQGVESAPGLVRSEEPGFPETVTIRVNARRAFLLDTDKPYVIANGDTLKLTMGFDSPEPGRPLWWQAEDDHFWVGWADRLAPHYGGGEFIYAAEFRFKDRKKNHSFHVGTLVVDGEERWFERGGLKKK